jgi:hypothetical protein
VNKIYIPSDSADRWKDLLAEPKKQWKKGYSYNRDRHLFFLK